MIAPQTHFQTRIHLLLLFSTTLVSTSFIVAELITDTLDPIVLTLVRFILAVIFLLPIISIRHGLAITVGSLCRYASISACLVLFFWAMFLSLRYTSPLNISVLFTLVPAISAVYAAIINRERISTSLLLALIVGLIGAVWVIFEGDLQRLRELAWNRGDLIFFGGCLAMALYTPLVKLLHRHEPMEVMTFWVLVTGCFWLLPGAVRIFARTSMTTIPSTTWLWIVYLALFSTVISFYCTQYATRIIGPTRTIAYSYLYPLLVVGLNYFLGRGWPAMQVIPGIVLTLAAMLLLLPSSGGDTGGVAED
ncbi:MAG: EamA family transporter [Desulfofustis sp.]|nr:EamA family transporter [Desulfofustis sp.]